ncbi:PREDICTED: ovocleidin-116-like, partial [Nestor notabilis]|uniref:ovocleidin-116-like n=1 Tax=Nestor notabilis TaxID=176057 RepID=UPI0005235D76
MWVTAKPSTLDMCFGLKICSPKQSLSVPATQPHPQGKVPPPPPGRPTGNCAGQHRILLKGCNAKHGFYVFKYVYSFSTRRNQTQMKKEEADSQSAVPGHQLGEDDARQGLTDDRAAPEHGGNGSTVVMEDGTSLRPDNRSTAGVGRDAHRPRPGTGARARGGVGIAGPTPASSEGSGDLDLVLEVDGGVSIVPEGGHSGGAVDEGSGEATIPVQGQEGAMQGPGTGGAALASVTEKMEDVQVDAKGVDEYAYIPDSSSITITQRKVGSTPRATSFTQISPDKDDEVNIFIGRANIHVGEQETTQAGATVGTEDDGIPAEATSSPLPRLGVTVAHDGNDDDGIPAHRQPEGLATTAPPREMPPPPGPPEPWVQHYQQPQQEGDEEADVTTPAEGASIRLGTTVASPGVSEKDCTTTLETAGGHK